jgi:hypothetical protein
MTQHSLSYWITLYGPSNEVFWDGMVSGWVEGDLLKLDVSKAEPELITVLQTQQVHHSKWEPVWEVIEPIPPPQLPPPKENTSIESMDNNVQ